MREKRIGLQVCISHPERSPQKWLQFTFAAGALRICRRVSDSKGLGAKIWHGSPQERHVSALSSTISKAYSSCSALLGSGSGSIGGAGVGRARGGAGKAAASTGSGRGARQSRLW